jgi:hypothetical protein
MLASKVGEDRYTSRIACVKSKYATRAIDGCRNVRMVAIALEWKGRPTRRDARSKWKQRHRSNSVVYPDFKICQDFGSGRCRRLSALAWDVGIDTEAGELKNRWRSSVAPPSATTGTSATDALTLPPLPTMSTLPAERRCRGCAELGTRLFCPPVSNKTETTRPESTIGTTMCAIA